MISGAVCSSICGLFIRLPHVAVVHGAPLLQRDGSRDSRSGSLPVPAIPEPFPDDEPPAQLELVKLALGKFPFYLTL